MDGNCTDTKGNRAFGRGGIPYCEVSISLPVAKGEGEERVNRFYEKIAEAVLTLGRETVLPQAKAQYEGSKDPRIRFTHRPYRLSLTCKLHSQENNWELIRTLTLTRRNRTLFCEKAKERILPSGRTLPFK